MKLTPQEQETLDAYNANASAFASTRNRKGDWAQEKEKFRQYLPSGKVLEVGCGGGRDAADLIEMGYEYMGTDISEELLKEARKNHPGITFLNQSVYELSFPKESFDGFWACAVLLHMPKERIDEALQSIHNVVKKGGIGFISLKEGDEEKFVEGDHAGLNYKRFFAFYRLDEFLQILKRNNFEVLESAEIIHTNKPWIVFFVKK